MGSVAARRGRPPKARVEGVEHPAIVALKGYIDAEATIPDPVPGDNGKALRRIVEYFKATEPDAWEELRLCPLQHGLEDMANRMRS